MQTDEQPSRNGTATPEEDKKRNRINDEDTLNSDAESQPLAKKRKISDEPKSRNSSEVHIAGNFPVTSIARPPIFLPSPDTLPYHATSDVPSNRQGFRYIPAEPSPPGCLLSHRTAESLPSGYVRTSWEDRSPYVRVSQDGLGLLGDKGFRSARLNVPVKEGKWYMEVRVEKGGGEGAGQGHLEGAYVRLGWGRREAPLNGPAGMDGYSYAFRDKTGEKVTLSRPKPYGKPFGSGDVIGLYISLPPRRKPAVKDPTDPARVVRKRVAISYKNQLYFESMDYPQTKEMIALADFKQHSDAPSKKDASMHDSQADKTSAASRRRKAKPTPAPEAPTLRTLPTLGPESCVAFFVNGECQGPAFTDLFDYLQLRASTKKDVRNRRNVPAHLRERENPFDDGSLGYYPFLSVFNDARVSINAGPDFDFPPPDDIDATLFPNSVKPTDKPSPPAFGPTWRPLCDRYNEFLAEEQTQDELDENAAQKAVADIKRAEEVERVKEDAKAAKKKEQDAKKAQAKKSPALLKKSRLGSEVVTAQDLADAEHNGNADDEAGQAQEFGDAPSSGPTQSNPRRDAHELHQVQDEDVAATASSASERLAASSGVASSEHSRHTSPADAERTPDDDSVHQSEVKADASNLPQAGSEIPLLESPKTDQGEMALEADTSIDAVEFMIEAAEPLPDPATASVIPLERLTLTEGIDAGTGFAANSVEEVSRHAQSSQSNIELLDPLNSVD